MDVTGGRAWGSPRRDRKSSFFDYFLGPEFSAIAYVKVQTPSKTCKKPGCATNNTLWQSKKTDSRPCFWERESPFLQAGRLAGKGGRCWRTGAQADGNTCGGAIVGGRRMDEPVPRRGEGKVKYRGP